MDQTTTTLTPPAPLTLAPPTAVAPVTTAQAEVSGPNITPSDQGRLDARVAGVVGNLATFEIHGDDFRRSVEAVSNLGNDEMQKYGAGGGGFLDRPLRSLQNGAISQTGQVSQDMLALRRQVEKLDPSRHEGVFSGPKKLMGLIPLGNRVTDYFRSYESAQTQINAIIESLYRGKDVLLQDIASIDQDKANKWTSMERLKKYSYVAQKLDDELTARIATIATTDAARAKVLNEEVLYRLRRRRQAFAVKLAVLMQSYLTMDLVRRTDTDLIDGVDEATGTTILALETAVQAAQALNDQKLVIDQIKGLNATTTGLILSTSEMLKQNSAEVAELSTQPSVSLDTLKTAFANIYEALDTVDAYKIKALDAMKQTIDGLQTEITKADTYLDKNRDALAGAPTADKTPALTVD